MLAERSYSFASLSAIKFPGDGIKKRRLPHVLIIGIAAGRSAMFKAHCQPNLKSVLAT